MNRHDIVAAVKKGGTNVVQLALANGLSKSAIHYAIKKPSERAETVLIGFLKKPAHEVFPDRYDRTGQRLVRRGRQFGTKIARHAAGGQSR